MKDIPALNPKSQTQDTKTPVSPEQRRPGFLFKQGGYMTIRLKLVLLLVMFAMLSAAMSGWHIYGHLSEVEEGAVRDAGSSAQAFAVSLAFVDETTDIPPIYKSPARLRDFISDRKRLVAAAEDFVVVDVNRLIIGDAVPEEIGKSYDEEHKGREVELTIRDGVTRTFIEKSSGHPEGIRQLVIPLKTEEGETVGAVIMEYTAYYNKYIALVKKEIRIILIFSALILFISLGIGYYLAGGIAGNIARLKKATEAMAAGDLEAKAEVGSKDELGDLARSFNNMAALRSEAEKKLRDNELRYGSLFEGTSNAVMIFDAETLQFEDANQRTLRLFGYGKEEFMNLKVHDVSAEKEKTAVAVQKVKEETPDSGYVPLRHFTKKDGTVFPGEIFPGTFMYKGRKKIIGVVNDITERIKNEEALEKTHNELVEKSDYLERFNRVMVGREIEMIKLKTEVNELLEKTGQPKKYEAPEKAEEL